MVIRINDKFYLAEYMDLRRMMALLDEENPSSSIEVMVHLHHDIDGRMWVSTSQIEKGEFYDGYVGDLIDTRYMDGAYSYTEWGFARTSVEAAKKFAEIVAQI